MSEDCKLGRFAVLRGDAPRDATSHYALVKLERDGDHGFTWLRDAHHELDGALRSMRYLAQKAKASYDPADVRGKKVIESIERHLRTIEELKTRLFDPVFAIPGDEAGRTDGP